MGVKLTIKVGALDEVDVDDLADLGEESDNLVLIHIIGETTDKDGATVDIVLAQELFIRIRARFLPRVEGLDTVLVFAADSLWVFVSTLPT